MYHAQPLLQLDTQQLLNRANARPSIDTDVDDQHTPSPVKPVPRPSARRSPTRSPPRSLLQSTLTEQEDLNAELAVLEQKSRILHAEMQAGDRMKATYEEIHHNSVRVSSEKDGSVCDVINGSGTTCWYGGYV